MRHPPEPVDAVASESPTELVVQSAASHGVAGLLDHLQRAGIAGARVLAQQELQHHRRRELGAGAEATGLVVVLAGEGRRRGVEVIGAECATVVVHLLAQVLDDVGADRAHLVAPVLPGVRECLQHLGERRHPLPRLGREVGAGEERLPLRGEDAGHGPAALARHGLGGTHVDGVDVGAFLAVDLDVDEVVVHERRGGCVLEGLVRHDVAPVASGVPDTEQDRAVELLRDGQCVGAPLPPVDRVVGVLHEVGTGRVDESVGHGLQRTGMPRLGSWRSVTHETTTGPASGRSWPRSWPRAWPTPTSRT